MHTDQHPRANQTARFTTEHRMVHNVLGDITDREFVIEDWWDHLTGKSWGMSDGNPAAIIYAIRGAVTNLPMDDEVIYVHVDGLGMLVHATEVAP